MSIRQKFAESFAKSKTMSGPEKKSQRNNGENPFKKSYPSNSCHDRCNNNICSNEN